jgi:hypothetical protein
MENTRQLQCKALRRLQKIRRRRNNGEQWKKQCALQWKQSEIKGECLGPAAKASNAQNVVHPSGRPK